MFSHAKYEGTSDKMITCVLTRHAIDRLRERFAKPDSTVENILTTLNEIFKEVEIKDAYLNVIGYPVSFPYTLEDGKYVCKTIVSYARYTNTPKFYKQRIEESKWEIRP